MIATFLAMSFWPSFWPIWPLWDRRDRRERSVARNRFEKSSKINVGQIGQKGRQFSRVGGFGQQVAAPSFSTTEGPATLDPVSPHDGSHALIDAPVLALGRDTEDI